MAQEGAPWSGAGAFMPGVGSAPTGPTLYASVLG